MDSQEWDWEVLIDDSHHHQQQQQQQQRNPNFEIGVKDEGKKDTSFSDGTGSVIHSDYFSLEFDSNSHGHTETGPEIESDKSVSETGSWIDPDQVQYSSTIMKGNSSNSSSQSEEEEEEEEKCENGNFSDTHENIDGDNMSAEVIEAEEGKKGCSEIENGKKGNENKGAWWKVPLELLRYCLLRVRPVWSLSVAAAAIMGFVLLRRAWLFKIKRKTQKGLRLNVTVDDKKVSQFMSRAARLNEAFSVVKRVPIIRPSLPAPGLAPWPVISMR